MEPNRAQPHQVEWPRWWAPLVIPAVLLTLVAVDATNRGVHVVHPHLLGELTGCFVIFLIVGVPAFIAGTLYARRGR
jgi:hypothetical protein